MSQKPSPSLFLNYGSAVINITAKVASLFITVRAAQIMDFHMVSGKSTDQEHYPQLQKDHGHQYSLLWQHGPGTTTQLLAVAMTMDLLMALHVTGATGFKQGSQLYIPLTPQWQHRLWTSTWPQTATQATHISMTPSTSSKAQGFSQQHRSRTTTWITGFITAWGRVWILDMNMISSM